MPTHSGRQDVGPRRADLLWVVGLAIGAVVLWHTSVDRPDVPFNLGSGDAFGSFLPSYDYQRRELAAGRFPQWNPYQGVGVPFLATLQPGALYPARLLLLATSPSEAMGWSALAHVILALLGTYALARRLGTRPAAAALAGMVFTMGFAVPWVLLPSFLEPGAWLPLLALAVVEILSGAGWAWVLVLGVGAAMPVLAGGYQITLYVGYALGIVALAVLLQQWARGDRLAWAPLGRLVVAGLLALATAAPQVLTTLAWSAETVRRTGGLTDLQILPLLTEAGRRHRIVSIFLRQGAADDCYLSIPVVALSTIGLVAVRPIGLVFGLTAMTTALLALVRIDTAAFELYKAIPGFTTFRFPTRILFMTAFFAAIGAALGLGTLTRLRVFATPLRTRLLEGAALALVVVLLVVPYRIASLAPWSAGPVRSLPDARFFPGDERPPDAYRVWVPGARLDLGGGIFVRQGMRQHVRVVQDYDPLSSQRLLAFLSAASGVPPPPPDDLTMFTGSLPGDPPVERPALLDLVAVRSVLVSGPVTDRARVARWTGIARHGVHEVFRNDRALPRAYVVERARFVEGESAALDAIADPGFDGHSEAVVIGTPSTPEAATLAGAPGVAASAAEIVVDEPDRIVVSVAPVRMSLLVVADAFAPGWSATLDGAPAHVWQTNHLVRGVIVPPGARRVELRYRAPGFRLGTGLALGAWTIVLGGLALARRRSATARSPSRAGGPSSRDR